MDFLHLLANHFLLKLVLAPLIIAAATMVSRRWGESIGGLLVGLPLTSAPVSVFFAIEQGAAFAANAARGAMLGLASSTLLGTLTDDDAYIGTISFISGLPDTNIISIDIGCDYKLNGVIISRLGTGNVKTDNLDTNAAAADKRTRQGGYVSIICGDTIPNISNAGGVRSLKLYANTVFFCGKFNYTVTQETDVSLTGAYHNYLFINLVTGNISVYTSKTQLTSVLEHDVNFGAITFDGDNIRSIDLRCDYTYNGGKRYVPYSELDAHFEKPYFIQTPIPNGWYQPPEDMPGEPAPDNYEDTVTLNDIYSAYDDLVSAYPGYAARVTMGNDASNTYPVYKYIFTPQTAPSEHFTKPLPRIVICTDTHGEEKGSTISLRNFVQDLCARWKTDPLLEFIRHNVVLVIIPVVNPYGFVNFTRRNANGVDLNRNGSYNWESGVSDPTSLEYRGPSPDSEVEMQYVKATINANLSAIAFFDYHMNGTSGEDYASMYWHRLELFPGAKGFNELQILSKWDIQKMTIEAQKRYGIPENSGYIGIISYNDYGGTLAAQAYHAGIPATVVECTRKFPGETGVYSQATIRLNTEYIGNIILNTLREFTK
jgi:hypothetical protein